MWPLTLVTSRPSWIQEIALLTRLVSEVETLTPKKELTTKFPISLKRCGLEIVHGRGQELYYFLFCYH